MHMTFCLILHKVEIIKFIMEIKCVQIERYVFGYV